MQAERGEATARTLGLARGLALGLAARGVLLVAAGSLCRLLRGLLRRLRVRYPPRHIRRALPTAAVAASVRLSVGRLNASHHRRRQPLFLRRCLDFLHIDYVIDFLLLLR